MEYLDFELRIASGSGSDYPVSVLRSPAGEASGTMHFPFDAIALQTQLQAIEAAVLRSGTAARDIVAAGTPPAGDAGAGADPAVVPAFGRQLFDALLAGPVRESFRRSADRARAAGKGLRVRLRVEDPALAALPWEYLFDSDAGDYVCLSSDTPLVRYLEADIPPEALTVQPPLSILGVVASPSDRPALDVARERQRIDAATQALRDAGLLKFTWLDGSTWRDVQRAMREGSYHAFHFIGHGGFDATAGEGVIALTDDDGKGALLTATQLGRLLADQQALRLVVLNSCLGARSSGTDVFSSTASTLIRRGVPAVVAMQYEISDGAAVEFARSLYEALAGGVPVDAAVAEARKAMSFAANRSVEWGTPVLHMRAPDGVLFRVGAAPAPGAAPAAPLGTVPAAALGASPAPAPTPPPPTPRPAAMDVYISYADVDDQPLEAGQQGWVDAFHRALQLKVGQWLGRAPGELTVWRDTSSASADGPADLGWLRGARTMVSVLSPGYVRTPRCTRELDAFCGADALLGGTGAPDRARVFKALKMPVAADAVPAPVQPLLGYEFFQVDPASGRPRELDQIFGADAKAAFWTRVEDLAIDIAGRLSPPAAAAPNAMLPNAAPSPAPPNAAAPVPPAPAQAVPGGATPARVTPAAAALAPPGGGDKPVVYLAASTRDVSVACDAIRRELERTGHVVLPDAALPADADGLATAVRGALARACLAVIPVGATYATVPEGGTQSVVEAQDALAEERSAAGALVRLVWTPPGLTITDARQQQYVAKLRAGMGLDASSDLVEARVEDVKTLIAQRLDAIADAAAKKAAAAAAAQTMAPADSAAPTVYVLCDRGDLEQVAAAATAIFSDGFDPVLPVFDGDETVLREQHEERLRTCDAVLVYYGAGTDSWMSQKLQDVKKARGQGRPQPMRAQAILVAPPATPAKAVVLVRDALVLRQGDTFAPDCLAPFVSALGKGA